MSVSVCITVGGSASAVLTMSVSVCITVGGSASAVLTMSVSVCVAVKVSVFTAASEGFSCSDSSTTSLGTTISVGDRLGCICSLICG